MMQNSSCLAFRFNSQAINIFKPKTNGGEKQQSCVLLCSSRV